MALKRKITATEFEKLAAHLQAEYAIEGDGYKLDIDGDEDTGALKRAKDREVQRRTDAEKRAQELEDKLADIEGGAARKSGDIATLEKAWATKAEQAKAEYEAKVGKLSGALTQQLIDNVAIQTANKLSKSPAVLLPHIRSRLTVDLDSDVPTTRILGPDGKPSELTLAQLEAEFVANKDFSAILIASNASGSAPAPQKNLPTGGAQEEAAKPLHKLTPKEMAAHIAAKSEQQA